MRYKIIVALVFIALMAIIALLFAGKSLVFVGLSLIFIPAIIVFQSVAVLKDKPSGPEGNNSDKWYER